MAIPLVTVLTAAPGVISTVSDIIKAVRYLRTSKEPAREKTIAEIEALLEQQALAMSELAESNRNLALAARTNRRIALLSLALALIAVVIAIVR
jgi:hypothetical protein